MNPPGLEPSRAAPSARKVLAEAWGGVRSSLVWYTRFGYTAKGFVYLAIGLLALAAIFGAEGAITDTAGALWTIARQPFGRGILVVLGFGLLGHASLRLIQGFLDPERRAPGVRTYLVRVGEALTGAGHVLLASAALRLSLGHGGPPNGEAQTRVLSGEMLALPYGDRLLGAVAIGIAAFGISLLVRAIVTRNICCDLDLGGLPPLGCGLVSGVIRFGLVSQGTIFTSIGWFALRAALDRQPRAARGPAGALVHFGSRPHGELILTVFACGLLAVAFSCFIDAWWRKFPRD